jgi:hypothetical protein
MLRDDMRGGAGRQHDDLVGERDGFFEIVRDKDDGFALIARLKGSRSFLPRWSLPRWSASLSGERIRSFPDSAR